MNSTCRFNCESEHYLESSLFFSAATEIEVVL